MNIGRCIFFCHANEPCQHSKREIQGIENCIQNMYKNYLHGRINYILHKNNNSRKID